jgi:formylglycine-generating enzyme required for sulfatase activity
MKERIVALCFILTAIVATRAVAVSSDEMLLGSYDCAAYGGEDSLAIYGDNLTVYPGSGEVILDFRRDQLPAASNTEQVVVHSILGEKIPATSLSEDVIVRLSIAGSTPVATDSGYASKSWMESHGFGEDYWASRDPRYWVPEITSEQKLCYRDVYPGIDFWYFDDSTRREFAFLARPGTSLSNITLRVDGTEPSMVDAEGNLVFLMTGATLVVGQPRIYQSEPSALDSGSQSGIPLKKHAGSYEGGGNTVRFRTEPVTSNGNTQGYNGSARLKEPELCMVSASGDTNGPPYDYYVGKFETRNVEFVDFLNSAERGTTNLLGTNLFFDAQGNVWINPKMKAGRDEVFSVAESRIVYRADKAVGERYAITDRQPRFGGSYTNHPVVGASWFGAVKYCNWLTLASGRGGDQRCYREGTNSWDWAPVTCAATNWQAGVFTASERIAWLKLRGFRLPMDNCSGNNGNGNTFSEFYKAGTWIGTTNVQYGFGRTNVFAGDANFRLPNATDKPDTTPVGFFDGSDHDGQMATRTNRNAYGIYDLSGNVEEWVNDVGITNSPLFRGTYGGSWFTAPPPMSSRKYARPSDTRNSVGFRVSSSYASNTGISVVRIPYYACLASYQRMTDEEATKAAEDTQEGRKMTALETEKSGTTGISSGVLKKKPPKVKPPKEGEGEGEDEDEDEDEDEGGGGGGDEVSPI